jgi:hypothetical protein
MRPAFEIGISSRVRFSDLIAALPQQFSPLAQPRRADLRGFDPIPRAASRTTAPPPWPCCLIAPHKRSRIQMAHTSLGGGMVGARETEPRNHG